MGGGVRWFLAALAPHWEEIVEGEAYAGWVSGPEWAFTRALLLRSRTQVPVHTSRPALP